MPERAIDDPRRRRPGRIAPPEAARAASTLASIDYDDAFASALDDGSALSAEQWARLVFEDSRWISAALYAIWTVLRLDLGARGSDAHVLGWRIVDASRESIVLEAARGNVHAQLVVWCGPHQLGMATFARYTGRGGRLLFGSIAPIHRRIVPPLLRRAASAGASARS